VVAAREGLPHLETRATQLRAVVDGYELETSARGGLIDLMLRLILSEVAWEADEAAVLDEQTGDRYGLWAMAWRARAGRWIQEHRDVLEAALR
jgi:hypothetical protein